MEKVTIETFEEFKKYTRNPKFEKIFDGKVGVASSCLKLFNEMKLMDNFERFNIFRSEIGEYNIHSDNESFNFFILKDSKFQTKQVNLTMFIENKDSFKHIDVLFSENENGYNASFFIYRQNNEISSHNYGYEILNNDVFMSINSAKIKTSGYKSGASLYVYQEGEKFCSQELYTNSNLTVEPDNFVEFRDEILRKPHSKNMSSNATKAEEKILYVRMKEAKEDFFNSIPSFNSSIETNCQ